MPLSAAIPWLRKPADAGASPSLLSQLPWKAALPVPLHSSLHSYLSLPSPRTSTLVPTLLPVPAVSASSHARAQVLLTLNKNFSSP